MPLPPLDPDLDLLLERVLDAPRWAIWACWTQARHIPHFFVPRPHRVTEARLEARVGGAFDTVFEVEGNRIDNRGVFLEVVEGEKLVFTDAYTDDWKPAPEPFMTAILLLADAPGGKTRYTAIARHRNAETAEQHRSMGFHAGWGVVADQLEEYAQGLAARSMEIALDMDAPPHRVWAALTDPAILPGWWGPEGFTCDTQRIDLREGGAWVFDMTGPDGTVWPNFHRITRMIAPQVYGYDLLHGEDGDAHAHSTLTLTPQGGGTRVTLRMVFADAEQHAMAMAHKAPEMGLQTLGKLARVA